MNRWIEPIVLTNTGEFTDDYNELREKVNEIINTLNAQR